jgi:hypothetical protein
MRHAGVRRAKEFRPYRRRAMRPGTAMNRELLERLKQVEARAGARVHVAAYDPTHWHATPMIGGPDYCKELIGEEIGKWPCPNGLTHEQIMRGERSKVCDKCSREDPDYRCGQPGCTGKYNWPPGGKWVDRKWIPDRPGVCWEESEAKDKTE